MAGLTRAEHDELVSRLNEFIDKLLLLHGLVCQHDSSPKQLQQAHREVRDVVERSWDWIARTVSKIDDQTAKRRVYEKLNQYFRVPDHLLTAEQLLNIQDALYDTGLRNDLFLGITPEQPAERGREGALQPIVLKLEIHNSVVAAATQVCTPAAAAGSAETPNATPPRNEAEPEKRESTGTTSAAPMIVARKRGRPPDTDAEADAKLYADWQSAKADGTQTYAQFADDRGLSESEVRSAIHRHEVRHRQNTRQEK